MTTAYDAGGTNWAMAVRQRRQALMQRVFMGTAAAVVFSPVMGWTFSLIWAGVYFAIQMLDLAVFAPITSGKTDRMGLGRTILGCLMLFINAAAFGSLSVPMWIVGGPMGGICAAILLSSGAIYAVINSPRSKLVLACTISAQLMYMAAIPVMMVIWEAETGFVTATSIALLVFGAYCINTWSRMNEARDAEASARIEAEHKHEQAERLMASRAAFLAAVSHDLRTPISAILTGASELEREATEAHARANAALIADAGMMMKALLDDLLDHAKLEAGRMTIDEEDFDLRHLLAQSVRLWQPAAAAKGLKLRVEGARQVPALVRGDPVRLRQILNNLLSNALKFTTEGSVCLRLQCWAEEPGGHALVIDVQDTGPGMSPAQLARLFTPFDQTEDGVSARHGGTGLGLSISRDLVGLMGGRLTARSAKGQGAIFTVAINLGKAEGDVAHARPAAETGRGTIVRALASTLAATPQPFAVIEPRAVPEPVFEDLEPAAPEPEIAGDDDLPPLRVLVVDDHDINRRAIQLILAAVDCEITMAADGMAALAASAQADFDVIFMDVRMPELDGRETTRRLRAGGGPNSLTPVIAVTADTAPEDIAACMAAGMTYFVSKPLTPGSLLGALSEVLSGPAEATDPEVAAA